MKKKKMALAMTAVACVATAFSIALAGCGGGGGTDWKSYTFDDFAKITQAEWDAKTIEHQFVIGQHGTNGMGSWYSLVNLYSDGSVIHLQGFDTGERPNGWNWSDEEHYIRWASYGYWEVSDGTLEYTNPAGTETADEGNIVITYTRWWDASLLDNDEPLEQSGATCQTEAFKNGDTFYIPENKLYEWFTSNNKGADPYGEELQEESPVKYDTLKAWYDSWKENQKEVGAGGPPGAGNPPASDGDIGS